MTLIDSRLTILAAFRALATDTGVSIDAASVDARLGVRLEDELSYWYDLADVPEAAAIYRRHYVHLAVDTTVLPGAHEVLACVREAGNATAIITAKHESSVEPCLTATHLQVDHVFGFVHGPEKADVLTRLDAVLYVGDTPSCPHCSAFPRGTSPRGDTVMG